MNNQIISKAGAIGGRTIVSMMLATLVAIAPISAHAADGVAQLRAFIGQVKSAQGSFAQHQNAPGKSAAAMPNGAATDSSGSFSFSRPGMFIWAYQKPYEQEVRSDGKTLYVYDKDLKQVTERALGAALSASPAAILFGSNDLESNFAVSDDGDRNGLQWAKLVPKAKDSQFKSVSVGFKDGELAAMTLYDVFGNTTELTFSNLKKNPAIDSGAFRFTPPQGVDVLKG